MRKILVPFMFGFGVTLAVIVGDRMTTDAMAVVIGVAVGVTASVPTSLLLVALIRRERGAYRGEALEPQPPAAAAYPLQLQPPPGQVIVLDGDALRRLNRNESYGLRDGGQIHVLNQNIGNGEEW